MKCCTGGGARAAPCAVRWVEYAEFDRCGMAWYEDIVDSAPHHVDLWSDLMVKLDLWKAPDPERVRNRAAASTHAVHATLPLSEVVANWDELAEALGGSVFEDMLA